MLMYVTMWRMLTFALSPSICMRRIQPLSEAEKQQAAVEEALRSSRVADSALQHSRRVGDLLLKNEGEEVQRVTEYAEELLDHEYRWACLPERCLIGTQVCQRHSAGRGACNLIIQQGWPCRSCARCAASAVPDVPLRQRWCHLLQQGAREADAMRAGQAAVLGMLHAASTGPDVMRTSIHAVLSCCDVNAARCHRNHHGI